MTTTPVTLYRISEKKELVLVGLLSRINFTPGLLPEVMKNVMCGVTPAMQQEELRHTMTFDCPIAPKMDNVHVIEVGDYFSLTVDQFNTMNDSGSFPVHCDTFVSLRALGPLKK